MLERFLVPNGSFVNYTAEHFVSLTISIIFSVYVLYFGKKYWNPEKQRLYITWLLILAASTQIMKIVIKNYDGSFDITKDLPLHLCNLMPFVMVAVMWAKNRKWWASFFSG
ncbi:MAG: YwaF family protein [Saprospiraceae bacterium]|nr:YwaF family protein [Saprospiraceae bacterium]